MGNPPDPLEQSEATEVHDLVANINVLQDHADRDTTIVEPK
jgi:hypothetical protein